MSKLARPTVGSVLLAAALAATPLLLAVSPFATPVWRLWQSMLWVGAIALIAALDRPIDDVRFGVRRLAAGIIGGVALFPATAVAHALAGLLAGRSAMPSPEQLGEVGIPVLVGGMLTAAVIEELAFRGALQSRLAEPFGPRGALLATAIVFALYHGGPVQWPAAFVLGIGFGWLALRYGLGAAVAAHLTYNVGGALLFLSAST